MSHGVEPPAETASQPQAAAPVVRTLPMTGPQPVGPLLALSAMLVMAGATLRRLARLQR